MLVMIYHYILTNTAPLYRVLYQNDYFFIDLWSINHFISGLILMIICLRKRSRHPFAIIISLLFIYEFLEMAFTYLAINIFRPEIIKDQFTDIVVGFFGGFGVWKFVRTKRKETKTFGIEEIIHNKNKFITDGFVDFIIAFGMSFLWVGYYGYNYNIALCNSPGINWVAFLLWGMWLMLTLRMHRYFSRIAGHFFLSLGLTWICYFFLLLLYEYIGYYVLNIRLVTNEGPLIFGVIHGKPVLKYFYMLAGVLAVLLSRLAKNILTAGQNTLPVNLYVTYGDLRSTVVANHDNRERSVKAL